ncbi:MAG: sigma-54 dependent transcriptional regulator [Acidobacteriaceae bacterium]
MVASAVVMQPASKLSPAGRRASRAVVLLIDSDPHFLDYLSTALAQLYSVTVCRNGNDALTRLREGLAPDIVFLDSILSDFNGLELLVEMRALRSNLRVIMTSCFSEPRYVVQAVKAGARDFLQKPLRPSDLEHVIEQCIEQKIALHENEERTEIPINENVTFVLSNKRMREIRSQCALVSRVDLPVLILGESGTGKEVIAQYIHKLSPRGGRSFLKVNCAAMPADLLESELFGYEQGAFTGAVKSKPGKFEICNGGTILLDEIGEMPPTLQAKLLHVLQDGTFSRLGSRSTTKVDVRVIAATNIDMKQAIADRRFREDLFYRLNGFTLSLPPLRERRDEIPLLLGHFMRRLAEKYDCEPLAISPQLMHGCMNHNWPGNLRELENFVKRFLVLTDEQIMLQEFVPPRLEIVPPGSPASDSSGLKNMVRTMKDDAEAVAITRALEVTRWNRKQAASELKISYKALLYKIRQYNLHPPQA